MARRIVLALILLTLSGARLPLTAQQPAARATGASAAAADAAPSALIVRGDDRTPEAHIGCGSIRFLVDSEDTAGAFAIVESNECDRPVTGLHRHHSMDEAFYVIEGSLTVYVDGRTHTLGAGSYFFIPRGTLHAQGNPCPVPNKVLVTFRPGGFERLLKYRGEVLQKTAFGSPEFRAAMTRWEGVFGETLGPDQVGQVPCSAK